jgi:hypothetical protein
MIARIRALRDADNPFKFEKCSQLLIATSDKSLSIVAMCVSNPDRTPARIDD